MQAVIHMRADGFPGKRRVSAEYHADLTRYFANGAEAKDSRGKLVKRADAYEQDTSWTLPVLASRLAQGEQLQTETVRHLVYCRLRDSHDVNDNTAKDCEAEMNRQLDSLQSFIGSPLRTNAAQNLSAGDFKRVGLERYVYLIERAKDSAEHALSPEAQRIADLLAHPLTKGWADRYDDIVRSLKAKSIETKEGSLDPLTHRSKIATHPNRKVRNAGFESELEAIQRARRTVATTLIDIAREKTALAKLHNYSSAPAWIYARRLQLTEPQVRATLDAMVSHAEVLKTYQRLRAERVSQVTGIDDVRSWDMALSAGYSAGPVSFPDARNTVVNPKTETKGKGTQ